MNFNPMQLMGLLMNNGRGLNAAVMNQLTANPLFRQAQQMSAGKSEEELRKTCENLCRQKGIDFNAALSQFQSQFPGMK